MSTPQIQMIMAKARADMNSFSTGTLDMSEIDMISSIGSEGRWAGNTLRDLNTALGKAPLHQAIHRFRTPLKSELCSWAVVEREQSIVLPHLVFATLCKDHPGEFQSTMVGEAGAMERFWADMVCMVTYDFRCV